VPCDDVKCHCAVDWPVRDNVIIGRLPLLIQQSNFSITCQHIFYYACGKLAAAARDMIEQRIESSEAHHFYISGSFV
jgi:hypothetical protein